MYGQMMRLWASTFGGRGIGRWSVEVGKSSSGPQSEGVTDRCGIAGSMPESISETELISETESISEIVDINTAGRKYRCRA
jgi:hypothetical protein